MQVRRRKSDILLTSQLASAWKAILCHCRAVPQKLPPADLAGGGSARSARHRAAALAATSPAPAPRTLAFRNAGITSSAKRCNCSSASDFGTPTDRLTEIRSSAGYFASSAFRWSMISCGVAGQEAAGIHRVLDPRQLRRRRALRIAHDLDLLVGHRAHQAQLAEHLHVLFVVFRRARGCRPPCCRPCRSGSRSTAARRVRCACPAWRAPPASPAPPCASRRPRPSRRRPCPGCRASP